MDNRSINQKLKRYYGEQDGMQNFRLANTMTQTEKRLTWVYPEVDGIQFPPFQKVVEKLRYEYLPRGYWALEKLFPVPASISHLLPEQKYSYEPIFIFKKSDSDEPMFFGESLVFSIVNTFLFKGMTKEKKMSLEEHEVREYEKSVDTFLQFLQDEVPSMATQLHFGEAIVSPGLTNGGRDNRITGSSLDSGTQTGNDS